MVGGGGQSIFYSLPLMLFGDDWPPLRSLWKPGDPLKINPPPSPGENLWIVPSLLSFLILFPLHGEQFCFTVQCFCPTPIKWEKKKKKIGLIFHEK